MNESLDASNLKLDIVRFSRGGRNKPQRHTYDQVLYVTGEKGIVATAREKKIVTPGFVAFVPSGELRRHGVTEDSAFEHISIFHPSDAKCKRDPGACSNRHYF